MVIRGFLLTLCCLVSLAAAQTSVDVTRGRLSDVHEDIEKKRDEIRGWAARKAAADEIYEPGASDLKTLMSHHESLPKDWQKKFPFLKDKEWADLIHPPLPIDRLRLAYSDYLNALLLDGQQEQADKIEKAALKELREIDTTVHPPLRTWRSLEEYDLDLSRRILLAMKYGREGFYFDFPPSTERWLTQRSTYPDDWVKNRINHGIDNPASDDDRDDWKALGEAYDLRQKLLENMADLQSELSKIQLPGLGTFLSAVIAANNLDYHPSDSQGRPRPLTSEEEEDMDRNRQAMSDAMDQLEYAGKHPELKQRWNKLSNQLEAGSRKFNEASAALRIDKAERLGKYYRRRADELKLPEQANAISFEVKGSTVTIRNSTTQPANELMIFHSATGVAQPSDELEALRAKLRPLNEVAGNLRGQIRKVTEQLANQRGSTNTGLATRLAANLDGLNRQLASNSSKSVAIRDEIDDLENGWPTTHIKTLNLGAHASVILYSGADSQTGKYLPKQPITFFAGTPTFRTPQVTVGGPDPAK